jgi:hypothetical protein
MGERAESRVSSAIHGPVALALLMLVGLGAFWPALHGVFTFDDYSWILNNPRVLHVASYGDVNRPVALLTFAANLWTHGPAPLGFHVVNVALHLANTALVVVLLRRLTGPWVATVGAGVFLLHPAQTEAVTYVSGRATSLAVFFLLLAHLAALRALDRRARRWTLASLVAFALAVLSKEPTLVYPLILAGWLIATRRLSWKAALRVAWPHFATAGCLLIVALAAHEGYRGLVISVLRSNMETGALSGRIEGLAGLTRTLVLPWTTSLDHGRRAIGVADLAMVAAAAAGVVVAWRTRKPACVAGAAWIITALLPTHLLALRTEPVADRLLYLPMVGVAMIAVALGEALAERRGRVSLAIAAAALAVTLGGLTVARNIQYQSEVAVWEDAVRKAPQNPRAHVNLAYACELAGALERSEREYRAALTLQPGLWWAEHGLRALDDKRQAAHGGGR